MQANRGNRLNRNGTNILSKWTWQRLLVSLAFTSLFTNVLFLFMPSEEQRCVAIHSALEEKYKAALRKLDELNASLSEHAEMLKNERKEFEREKEEFQRLQESRQRVEDSQDSTRLAAPPEEKQQQQQQQQDETKQSSQNAGQLKESKREAKTMKTSEILRILHMQGISTYGIVEKSELVDLLEKSSVLKENNDAGCALEQACASKEQVDEGIEEAIEGERVVEQHKQRRFAEFARTSAKAATGVILCTAVWDATAFLGNPLAVPGLVMG